MFLLSKNKLLFLILLFLGEKVSFGMFLFQNSLGKGCRLLLQQTDQNVTKNHGENSDGTFYCFEKLSIDERMHIITFLDPVTVKNCSTTCKLLHEKIPLRYFIKSARKPHIPLLRDKAF